MLLIGSQALLRNGINPGRKPRDWDYIATFKEVQEFVKAKQVRSYPLSGNKWVAFTPQGIYEFEIAWPGSSASHLLVLEHDSVTASLETLLALKLSHRYLRNSPHFLKTMDDIWLLRKYNIEVKRLKEWLKAREKETYNYPHPGLNKPKKEFFDASVTYKYDHDSIHRAVALACHPAYTFYMVEGAEVQCSKEKFEALTLQDRIAGVLEEAYVLAIERSLVPWPGVKTPKEAFDMALMKVCTSITSGWFREFAWEHYYQVQERNNALGHNNYWLKFNAALAAGEIPFHV